MIADERDDEADGREHQHLTDEPELLLIEPFQLLVEELRFYPLAAAHLCEHVTQLATHRHFVHTGRHTDVGNAQLVAPIDKFIAEDDEGGNGQLVAEPAQGQLPVNTGNIDRVGHGCILS